MPAPADPLLDSLPEAQRPVVEARLQQFQGQWDEKRLGAELHYLPPRGDPLRPALLLALAGEDLRQRWRRGQRPTVEAYLKACPELGGPEAAPVSLLLVEREARLAAGLAAPVEALAARFPQRAAELRQRLAAGDATSAWATTPPGDARSATEVGSGPGSVAPASSLPERFGRYRILRRLGQGGMGAVYLAEDTQLDRRVALKVPTFAAADGHARERFLREARTAATLEHPNICPVHDVGEQDGVLYLTMAFVEGRSLAEEASRAPMAPRRAALLVHKLALALAEAHARGVIHRDLKPANVMLNQRGEPVLMDFGLARHTDRADERVTQSGVVVGTPAYMAPEQVEGDADAQGPHTDIYSLGAVLYELLAGRPPFTGQVTKVLVQVLHNPPVPPSAVRAGIDPALEAVCLRALAKRPAQRFPTMAELAAALRRFLDHPAGPPPLPEPAASGPPTLAVPPATAAALPAAPPPLPTDRLAVMQAAPTPRPAPELPVARVEVAGRPDREEGPRRAPARARLEERGNGAGVYLWVGLGALALVLVAGVAVLVVLAAGRREPAPAAAAPPAVAPPPPFPFRPPAPAVPVPPMVAVANDGLPLPAGWQRFRAPAGGYSVAMPGVPTPLRTPIPVAAGRQDLVQYVLQQGLNTFSVGHADVPALAAAPNNLERTLGDMATGAMRVAGNPKLLQQKLITANGRDAGEIVFEGDSNGVRCRWVMRVFLVGPRTYVLMARTPLADAPSEAGRTFLDSFRIEQ